MITAHSNGMWNNRLSATALPRTSARSQAPMATSLISQLASASTTGTSRGIGKVFAGDDAEARGNTRIKIATAGEADDPQQTVFELSAALEIGAPVAGDPCSRR